MQQEEEDDDLPLVQPKTYGFSRRLSLASGIGGLPEGQRKIMTAMREGEREEDERASGL